MQRPTSVTVIGWLYVVFGIFMLFGGAFGLAISSVIDTAEIAKASQEMPPAFRTMTRVFFYFDLLAAVQLVVAIVVIISGAAFLKLRPWSRPVLEIFAWLALAYLIGFGAFWIWSVTSVAQAVPADAQAPTGFFAIFTAVGIVMILAFAVPPAIIIRFLRSTKVRSAFKLLARAQTPIHRRPLRPEKI